MKYIRSKRRSVAIVTAVVFFGSAWSVSGPQAQDATKWTSNDFRERLIGKTAAASGKFGGGKFQWVGYYRPDGRITGRAWGPGWQNKGTGNWRIRSGKICNTWTVPDWNGCFEYYDKGNRTIQLAVSGPGKGNWYTLRILGNGNIRGLTFGR